MTGTERNRREEELVRAENELLRKRVSDLERKLARSSSGPSSEGDAFTSSFNEREALLAEAERIAHMGSWVWDVSSNRVVWSDELFHILGYDAETQEASTEAFFASVHPQDQARVRDMSQRGIKTGLSEHVEFRLLLPDGRVREVSMDGALLFDDTGALKRAVGAVLDCTEARAATAETRRAHRLLEETQRLTSSGSWEWDLESDGVRWSNELFRILGVPDGIAPSVELFRGHLHPEDLDEFDRLMAKLMGTGQSKDRHDCRIVRGDGEVRRVQITSGQMRDVGDRLVSIYGTITDMTLQRELEERLYQAQKMEAIGQLSGGIAHDFNNLLMVLLAAVERIRVGDAVDECLEDIETASRSAATLTQRLLAFSRRAVVVPAVVDLKQVLEEIRPLVVRTIGEEIKTSFEYASEGCMARVDPHQLHQVMLNLVVNARDAMQGGGDMRVRLERASLEAGAKGVEDLPAGEYTVIQIQDSGAGIEPAIQGRIFEPFFTTKEVGKGTGLGLSMVYGAMKQCGGGVAVESRAGGGTTFRLYFPSVAEGTARPPPRAMPSASSLRVLLVEDDAQVRRSLEGMLRRAGCDVVALGSAKEAISAWSSLRDRVDLLATDVVMPDMRGDALAAHLVAQKPGLPVLFMTGYADRTLVTNELTGGVVVLQKPFRSEELRQALADLSTAPRPSQKPVA